jgi:hypothetical protein
MQPPKALRMLGITLVVVIEFLLGGYVMNHWPGNPLSALLAVPGIIAVIALAYGASSEPEQ